MKKKFLNVIALSALVGLGAITAVACGQDNPTEDPTEVTFKVTYDTGNYTVTGIKTDGYKEGETVSFTVTAAEGYEIISVSAGGTTLTGTNGSYSFTMGKESVKLTIAVEPVSVSYKVTYDAGNYTVSGINADGYKEGDTVTFTVTPSEGYLLKSVAAGGDTLTPSAEGEYSFKMGKADVKLTISVEVDPRKIEFDKTELVFDTVGKSDTVKATLTELEGTVTWEITDDVNFKIEVSEDTLSCTVTNLGGGQAVLTAYVGGKSADVSVVGSIYTGDPRSSYTIYKDDGTVLFDDVKGLYNAIGKLNTNETVTSGYVTAKGETDKLYVRDNAWLSSLAKGGPTDETEGLQHFADGKVPSWVPGYPTHQVDELEEANIIVTQKESGSFNYFNQRATNWFVDGSLKDKMPGYVPGGAGSGTQPSLNLWSGWRASEYLGSVTTAQYVSWHDGNCMGWNSLEMTWDLSDSYLVPSFNDEQGVFAQLYIGSTTRIQKFTGMYFDAGTMAEAEKLEDGATRDIYTFTEDLSLSGGVTTGILGTRTINEEKPIGQAVWDSFNKAWTFPNVKITVQKDFWLTGEDENDPDANYYCIDTVTGYKEEEEVASVEYKYDFGSQIIRGVTTDNTGAILAERFTYGASFTPEYGANQLADITCGAKWTNVLCEEALARNLDGSPDKNLQFMLGRTTNSGAQLAILGADSCTGSVNSEEQSVFDFHY